MRENRNLMPEQNQTEQSGSSNEKVLTDCIVEMSCKAVYLIGRRI